VTSSGHMEEIQELLLPKSNSNFSDGWITKLEKNSIQQ
jgi:allantoicase